MIVGKPNRGRGVKPSVGVVTVVAGLTYILYRNMIIFNIEINKLTKLGRCDSYQ